MEGYDGLEDRCERGCDCYCVAECGGGDAVIALALLVAAAAAVRVRVMDAVDELLLRLRHKRPGPSLTLSAVLITGQC